MNLLCALFGHHYQPRYGGEHRPLIVMEDGTQAPIEFTGFKFDMAQDISVKNATSVFIASAYSHDVCRRCGHIVNESLSRVP